jgi:phospholipid transport system substrate-binding protein
MRTRTLGPMLGALYAVMVCLTAVAADVAPDALVKRTVDDVLQVIKQNRDRRTLIDLAEKKVLPHFDFERMTRLAVGKAWRDATPEQRKALENGFRSLLVNTYTAALSQSETDNPTVEMKPLQANPADKEVLVKSVVRQPGKQPVEIDYRMERVDNGWKVYDVIVENLSLVTNYRSTFASEVSRGGIDGLIKSIETKNRQVATS